MFVLGLGLGCVMQVLVLAVQNSVDYKDLGVATSGATLFRSIGGTVGIAVLGSIFNNRLVSELRSVFPRRIGRRGTLVGLVRAEQGRARAGSHRLSHAGYLHAFTQALSTIFEVAAAIGLLAFALSWALPDRTLRDTADRVDRRRRGVRESAPGEVRGRGGAGTVGPARPGEAPPDRRQPRRPRRRRPVSGSVLAGRSLGGRPDDGHPRDEPRVRHPRDGDRRRAAGARDPRRT